MNKEQRAQMIIRELIAVPKDMWDREEHGGQAVFVVEGHSGHALYFSRTLMDPNSDHPMSRDAQEIYRKRLGKRQYAVEVWQDGDCVCLLRWDDVEQIEIAEYQHGPWELLSFSLPPIEADQGPTLH